MTKNKLITIRSRNTESGYTIVDLIAVVGVAVALAAVVAGVIAFVHLVAKYW